MIGDNMELKFLGRGAAFYPVLGNTSAYDICDNNLFLIDCGETIFKKLFEKDIFNKINNIYIFITHTHSDHIGSLSSLIFLPRCIGSPNLTKPDPRFTF